MFLQKTSIAAMALALGGCASIMVPAQRVEAPQSDKALVTFVREAVFLGDGLDIDLWDGTTYVGSLGAGKMIQYETKPGKHLFMGSSENWSYADADLEAGKQYYLKANIFPGLVYGRVALGVVKQDDLRVPKWQATLKPTQAPADAREKKESSGRFGVEKAMAQFEAGGVGFTKVNAEHAR